MADYGQVVDYRPLGRWDNANVERAISQLSKHSQAMRQLGLEPGPIVEALDALMYLRAYVFEFGTERADRDERAAR